MAFCKKMPLVLLIILSVLCTGIPAIVSAAAGYHGNMEKVADRKQKKTKRKVVCKREAQIGSRIKKRVCRSVVTMERDAQAGRRMMDRVRTSVGVQTPL